MNKIVYLFFAILFMGCNSPKNKSQHQCSQRQMSEITSEAFLPEWSHDAVIYEVNVRQYTPEGTFDAFSKHLPRLQELGVKILWFMPIHPISVKNRKGSLGSYYAVQDYKKVNPEFGTFDDFKKLVEQAHDMGFKVILDWVANHTGWDGPWITNHPEWYNRDSLGHIIPPVADWSDVADLNYNMSEMRAAMIDALKFWVAEANIDGYRCDVAGMVPVDFWEEARAELDKIKPMFMLAEDESESELLVNAFNANYGWEFHHIMNMVAKGEAGVPEVKAYFEKADTTYPVGSFAMHFTSNHDENSWNGTEYERLGDAVKTMAALSFTVPGMPLIYTGQEAGLNKRLAFFDKDQVDWSKLEMQVFYKKLIQLKKENPALWNGSAGGNIHFLRVAEQNGIVAFTRQKDDNKIIVVMNLTQEPQENEVLCCSYSGKFIELYNGEQIDLDENKIVKLDGWQFKIFVAQRLE